MTTKKHFKRRVRSRAAQTGEPYATALRKIRELEGIRMPTTTTATTTTATTTTGPPISENAVACCSFCGKPNTQVQRLVAGPGVYICNECVALAAWVVEDAAGAGAEETARRRAEHQNRSAEDLLATLPALVESGARVDEALARVVKQLRERGADWPTIADAANTSVEGLRRQVGDTATE